MVASRLCNNKERFSGGDGVSLVQVAALEICQAIQKFIHLHTSINVGHV